jgi:hypothetical protein
LPAEADRMVHPAADTGTIAPGNHTLRRTLTTQIPRLSCAVLWWGLWFCTASGAANMRDTSAQTKQAVYMCLTACATIGFPTCHLPSKSLMKLESLLGLQQAYTNTNTQTHCVSLPVAHLPPALKVPHEAVLNSCSCSHKHCSHKQKNTNTPTHCVSLPVAHLPPALKVPHEAGLSQCEDQQPLLRRLMHVEVHVEGALEGQELPLAGLGGVMCVCVWGGGQQRVG